MKVIQGDPMKQKQQVFFLLIFSQGVQLPKRTKPRAKTGDRPIYSLLIETPTIQVVSCLQVLGTLS